MGGAIVTALYAVRMRYGDQQATYDVPHAQKLSPTHGGTES